MGFRRPPGQRVASRPSWAFLATVALLVAGVGVVEGQEPTESSAPSGETEATPTTSEPAIDFGRDIRPLLARRCYACHGPGDAESGLALHTAELALTETDSGQFAIVPGQPEASHLLDRITSTDEYERMPPEGKPLTEDEVSLLRRWIAEGANFDGHWAYRPIAKPEVPPADGDGWAEGAIDRFIYATLRAGDLYPNPEADRRTLIRRLSFDLTGLPPTPEEVDAFINDPSDKAYENLVDRLLASPHYGERWARHWLDVVRYGETNSYERDGAKPNAWRYRDYIIKSLNEDKPYSDFVVEQLAGDLLETVTPESMTATGYYRLGIWDDEPADPIQAKYDELDSLVATTGQGFLGLTVNCARCHDHKIDPVLQSDYFRMLAFFADVTPYGERGNQHGYSQYEITPPDVRAEHDRLDAEIDRLAREIERIEERGRAALEDAGLKDARNRRRDREVREKLASVLSPEDRTAREGLLRDRRGAERDRSRLAPRQFTLGLATTEPTPRKTHIHFRGNPHSPTDEVRPGFPVLFGSPDPFPAPAPKAEVRPTDEEPTVPTSVTVEHPRDARLHLARWIASPENPLTARVIVNRLWQHHFGRGIVRSPNNFGLLGTPPTHPELLDHLATELVAADWRLKPIHKAIVMSRTYRMSSDFNELSFAKDSLNDRFWRFDPRRLDAEEIRDALLATADVLNPKLYGPSFFPEVSDEVKAGQSKPGEGWGKSSPEEQRRRSVYIHIKRSLVPPELANFDFPESDISCEARFNTTQPGQALGMVNGQFLHERAEALAERVRKSGATTPEDQIRAAIRFAYQREATESDLELGRELMTKLRTVHDLDQARTLRLYCLAVYNANEFIYLD